MLLRFRSVGVNLERQMFPGCELHESHPARGGVRPDPDPMSAHPKRRGLVCLTELEPTRYVATSLWRMCVAACCETELIPRVPTILRGVSAGLPSSYPTAGRAATGIRRPSA